VAGRTIAVRLSSGERIWEQSVGSAYTPIVSGNAVFLVDLEDNMLALDRATGKTFWRTSLPVVRKKRFFSVWAGPSLAGGVLWAVSNDGKIISVDPNTGNLLTDRSLGAKAYAKPTAAAGQLLVLAGDGSLIAYR
jgi:outer membrane protein assembly factor BamB